MKRRAAGLLPALLIALIAPASALALAGKGALPGYTLFAPIRSTTTYLVDLQGNVVHTWKSAYPPGQSVYLLASGHLLRTAREPGEQAFSGGGIGGRLQEIAWDGTVVWEFVYADGRHMQHHDIAPLPNGNVLLIAWERRTRREAIAAGRDPALLQGKGELWPLQIVEVKPRRPRGGAIVWEWHVWDHLIQERDPTKGNFGVVAEHPERVDLNADRSFRGPSARERRRLEALGYLPPRGAPGRGRPGEIRADWLHTNSIDYNPERDEIVLSIHSLNEVWIIDHGTTTPEAAGHRGGRRGKGGDLLYRWGNPEAYGAGTGADRRLFGQHDARWVRGPREGSWHILLFNNGAGRQAGGRGGARGAPWSSVEEIALPFDSAGGYAREPGRPFGPAEAAWSYTAPRRSDFFSSHISGAERLPNGNTLICSGEKGRIFEVDREGTIVWEYVNPFQGTLPEPPPPGRRPFRGPRGMARGRGNALFRATRIPAGHPGLAGRRLAPPRGRRRDVSRRPSGRPGRSACGPWSERPTRGIASRGGRDAPARR